VAILDFPIGIKNKLCITPANEHLPQVWYHLAHWFWRRRSKCEKFKKRFWWWGQTQSNDYTLHDHLGQVRKKRFPLYNSLKKY